MFGEVLPNICRRVVVRVLGSVVSVAALFVLFPVGSANAATLATGFDRCPHGSLCLFEDDGGEGEMYIVPGQHVFGLPEPIFDDASSAWNRSPSHAFLLDHWDGTGEYDFLCAYGPPVELGLEDRASSVVWADPRELPCS